MKLFVVEDCPLIREFVRLRCAALDGWEIVGEPNSAEEAIRLLPSASPDIILLDIGLPDDDGFTVAEFARTSCPMARILVLSGYLNEYTLSRCEALRVSGFIGKPTTDGSELTSALTAASLGKTFFSNEYLSAKTRWLADPCAVSKRLSEREVEVMLLMARGRTDEEIAFELGITESTAKTQRGKVIRRLNLSNTPKLMAHAVSRGFGEFH